MIMERGSELKVSRSFCDNPFDRFSVAEMSGRTGISRNWIYSIIEKFERSGILEKSGKRYKLDFSELFCKRLKLLFDSEYLNSLDRETKERVFNIANKIIFEMDPQSVVLVGSVALNRQRRGSDTDFLVIGGKKNIPYFENCNITHLGDQEFKEKYLKGDDFIISALLFGKIISDKCAFMKFFESPLPIFSQELIQEKLKYCERLEARIYALLRSDEEEARRELLYLSMQVARVILLRNSITPKTKYDLAGQVRPFDEKIAGIVERLIEEKELRKAEALRCIKACMGAIS